MTTTREVTLRTGMAVAGDQDFDVTVLAGLQRQGDLLVVPAERAATTPVAAAGTTLVRGHNGGNDHVIHAADGPVYCDIVTPRGGSLCVATLTVPVGSTAYLGHPEHGYLGIASGTYEIRRQREMSEAVRMVAD